MNKIKGRNKDSAQADRQENENVGQRRRNRQVTYHLAINKSHYTAWQFPVSW
jgi:hypothetical protein